MKYLKKLVANRIILMAFCIALLLMIPTSQGATGLTDTVASRPEVLFADLYEVSEKQFLGHMAMLELQEDSVFAARALLGTLTHDLLETDLVLLEFWDWNGARPARIYPPDSQYESSIDQMKSRMIQRGIELNRKAVDRYYDQLDELEGGHHDQVEKLRRRHHRSMLTRSRNAHGLEGVSVDVIDILEATHLRLYGLPFAAEDFKAPLASYESSLESLSTLFDEKQIASWWRSFVRTGETQVDQEKEQSRWVLENKIREANRRCVEDLAKSLSGEFAEEFLAEIRGLMTPSAWSRPYYRRFAEYALQNPEVETSVAESIRETLQDLDRRRHKLSQRVEEAYDVRHAPQVAIKVRRLIAQSENPARREKTDSELALQVATQSLSRHDIDGLKRIRGILGQSSNQMHEAWLEQISLDNLPEEPVARDPLLDYDGSLPSAEWSDLEDILSRDVGGSPEKAKLIESRYESYREAFGKAKHERDAELALIPSLEEAVNNHEDENCNDKVSEILLLRGEIYAQWSQDEARAESQFRLEIQDLLGEELGAQWMDSLRRQRRDAFLPVLELLANTEHRPHILPDLVSLVEDAKLSAEGMILIENLIGLYVT
ncbi:MAG: hypothetical protein O7G85_05645, partial [Planctomycetota bacterium]|nr:hypothetical protein [Planctomycetota bacterium]